MNIKNHGSISIEPTMLQTADSIKYQNYKTNTPKQFQINSFHYTESSRFIFRLSDIVKISPSKLDFVYFSVCKGAEPHIDLLDKNKFEPTTFVVPIILPNGESIITAEDERIVVELNNIYEFNHEKIHSMVLEDTESGFVVIMVAVLKG